MCVNSSKYFNFTSLRVKLILLIAAILLPLFAFSLYSSIDSVRAARSAAFAASENTTKEISKRYEYLIDRVKITLQTLSSLTPIAQLDRAASESILAKTQESATYKLYAALNLVLPNGDLYASSFPGIEKANFVDRRWFQTILQNRSSTIGEYTIARVTGSPILPVAEPVLDKNGTLKSILVAAINLEALNISQPLGELPEGSVIMLFDQKGTTLMRHPEDGFVGKTTPYAKIVRNILSTKEGTIQEEGVDGKMRLYAFTMLGGTEEQIFVSVGFPMDVAFAGVKRMMVVQISLLGAVVLMAFFGSRWIGNRYIEQPIKQLLKTTQCLAAGELSVRTGLAKYGGEIGELAFAFDQMANSLQAQDAELRMAKERLERASFSARVALWDWNIGSEQVEWSQVVDEMLGFEPGRLPRNFQAWEDILHPDDKTRVIAAVNRHLESGEPYEIIYRVRRKDGSYVWWNDVGVATRNERGEAELMSGACIDITERKQAEEKLRRYDHIVSNTQDTLALVDNNFTYLSANAAFLKALGKTQDEVIGRTQSDVLGESYFNKVIRPWAERCLAGADVRYQTWFEYPAVGRKYMDVAYSPYSGSEGEIKGFVVASRDITEQENLKGQLIQAQKMESVGRLAGGVAHDYNNALNVVIGFTELAMEKIDPAEPLHADLNEVLNAARHATDITRQLLAFARKQIVAPVVLDLNDNIETMLKMLRRLIGEDIDLAWLPGTDLWPVKMDPSQVDQILANLCVNARDAIAGVGKVTIETATKVIDAAYCVDHVGFIPGEFVLMAVSDNGSGMDKEILKNIFEPFFTTKEVGKGTGLGLATVYGIVKQNKGFINVYSEPGKGTSFKIYLPRHEGEAAKIQEESTVEILSGIGETILVVEDDITVLKLAKIILDDLGYSVLIAPTPSEALSLAEEHAGKIQLLITDVIMPEMNGHDLAKRLQSICPGLKCVFMSGYTRNAIAHHGVLDEGVNFVQKPFSKRDLAITVRKVLDEIRGTSQ